MKEKRDNRFWSTTERSIIEVRGGSEMREFKDYTCGVEGKDERVECNECLQPKHGKKRERDERERDERER